MGKPRQTHQAPEDSEECSKDEVCYEHQVSRALEETFLLFFLYLPHRRKLVREAGNTVGAQ